MKTITLIMLTVLSLNAAAETILIENAKVSTATDRGTLDSADVLVTDGVIVEVSNNIRAPSGAKVVDASGAWLTPGLMDSSTQVGLGDVSSGSVRTDHRVDDTDLGAGFQVGLAIDSASIYVPILRTEGVTRAIVRPSASDEVFAGQSAVIALGNGNVIVDESNAVFLYLGEGGRRVAAGSRAKALIDMLDAFDEAGRYATYLEANKPGRMPFGLNTHQEWRQSPLDLKALIPVVRGEKKLAVVIDRASDIEMLLDKTADRNLDMVLIGATEAWKVADLLAARDVPVVLDVMDNAPRNFDRLGARLDNAALLAEAGVRFAFMTNDLTGDNRTLTQQAGVSVAYGLDWDSALQAVTSSAAEIWGIDTYGSIAAGMEADLVLWDGDPLEVTSAPTMVMIKGEEIELTSRMLRLRDRYRDLSNPKSNPFGYR